VRCLRKLPGVADVCVTHIRFAHYDGQSGLAIVVIGPAFDLRGLQLGYEQLPSFARPRFLRLIPQPILTPSFKFDCVTLRKASVDPAKTSDPLYVYARDRFLPVTCDVWRDLTLGHFRL
jgi:fatty-acyl-CoA synthase